MVNYLDVFRGLSTVILVYSATNIKQYALLKTEIYKGKITDFYGIFCFCLLCKDIHKKTKHKWLL